MSALDLALVALFLPVVVATFALVVAPFRRAGLPMAFLSVLTALAKHPRTTVFIVTGARSSSSNGAPRRDPLGPAVCL